MPEATKGSLSHELPLAWKGQVVNLIAGTSPGFDPGVLYLPLLCKRISWSAHRYRGGRFHRSGSHSPQVRFLELVTSEAFFTGGLVQGGVDPLFDPFVVAVGSACDNQ